MKNEDYQVMTYESLLELKRLNDLTYTKTIIFDKNVPLDWTENKVVIIDSRFLSDNRYIYLIFPVETSRKEYLDHDVRPRDITIDGEMEFVCASVPTEIISVTILRMEVQ